MLRSSCSDFYGSSRSATADVPPLGPAWGRALQGPWPLVAGAIGLAAVNVATLALAGRPWGVTSAFGLWGSKALAWMGAGVASWPYWTPAARAAELHASVFRDITSVMDSASCSAHWRRRAGRSIRANLARARTIARGCDRRGAPSRLRGSHRLRLQHRRVLQRRVVGQPAWLGVVRRGLLREYPWHAPAASVRDACGTR